MRFNTTFLNRIGVDRNKNKTGRPIRIGSVVTTEDPTQKGIKYNRIFKVRTVFHRLKHMWKFNQYSRKNQNQNT